MGALRPAVFLDRDGVLVREVGFITRPDQAELLTGAAEGLATLKAAGFTLVVATNQSGIARRLLDGAMLARIHAEIARKLKETHPDAAWDAVYHCPHLEEGCDCRKPKAGMLLEAAADLLLDLKASWMIGDAERDLAAGRSAGCRTVCLPDARGAWAAGADLRAADLREAASLILKA